MEKTWSKQTTSQNNVTQIQFPVEQQRKYLRVNIDRFSSRVRTIIKKRSQDVRSMFNLYKLHWILKVKQQTQNTNLAFCEYSVKSDKNIRCCKCVLPLQPNKLMIRRFHVTNGHKCHNLYGKTKYDICHLALSLFLYYSQINVIY